ncbi:hypothetical protein AB6A40_008253 [Gnathostoma spinigerum]|uniref:non-specific protein-tyrosine kinase n=1 Tax=Gnathostoma spinigerum TaxID=75299 RepID=A0ABD6EWB0_9BILA
MHKMKHECVVRLYGVVLDTKAVMLVSELAPNGSLLDCLQRPALRGSFFVDVLCDFAHQIASGMEYLASERLIHRDLAARNVLVFSADKVKISDFGLSRSLGMGEDYYRGEFTPGLKLPIAWCAPEAVNFLKFTSASDVWSYGVTLFEMFSYGQMPWAGMSGGEILQAVDYPRHQRLECPDACPADIYALMMQCWAHEPEERPTFSDILAVLNDLTPQWLITVSSCHDGVLDHLQYMKKEEIVVLDRSPSAYPDGYYWRGIMRNGRTGLFRPDETVAKLGAESPLNKFESSGHLLSGLVVSSDKVNGGSDKNKGKNKKKKLIISEPQGNVRHTCHVGIDGSSFGLMQIDKNDLARSLPPSVLPATHKQSQISPVSMESIPSLLTDTNLSTSHLSLAQSIHPPKPVLNVPSVDHQHASPPPLPVAPKPMRHLKPKAPDPILSSNSSQSSLDLSPKAIKSDALSSDSAHSAEIVSVQSADCSCLNFSDHCHADDVKCTEEESHKQEKSNLSGSVMHKCPENDVEYQMEEFSASQSERSYCLKLDKSHTKPPLNWTEEAQNAYKLLVQFGDDLQQADSLDQSHNLLTNSPSPIHPSSPIPSPSRSTSDAHLPLSLPLVHPVKASTSQSSTTPPDTTVNQAVWSPSNSSTETKDPIKLSDYEGVSVSPLKHLRSNNVLMAHSFPSRNGLPAHNRNDKVPPPVPPKPKARTEQFKLSSGYSSAPGGFASAVAKTALFSKISEEDVMKF